MTLVNPKPLGHAYGEKLSSTNVDAAWVQLPFAVDNRAGALEIASRSLTRACFSHGTPDDLSSLGWARYRGYMSTVSNAQWLGHWYATIPNGATITDVTFNVDGQAGRAGLPANTPHADVNVISLATGAETFLGHLTDPTAVLVTYEGFHSWSLTGLAHVFDASNSVLAVTITSESGANSQAGGRYYPPTVTYTIAKLDESA